MARFIIDNEFYCTNCGKKGINVVRKVGKERESGHLKKLFCLNCQKEVNFCEIQEFAQNYTYDDFLLEYKYNNFENGQRKLSYKEFKQNLKKKGLI